MKQFARTDLGKESILPFVCMWAMTHRMVSTAMILQYFEDQYSIAQIKITNHT